MKNVSVVVPAYRSGDGINRVVRSLDAQTMSTDDFELIIVDDGSPDGTWKRLEAIRDARSYVRIERIENSGWPSRPRNVGTDMAEGEYVLYMDHDDELYPDGLRAAYEYASKHSADVLSAKESKTSDISWGISNFTADIPNAKPSRGISSLLPMMPHKFYRTAFLREHDIRFPEGRRMLWEDIYFNVAAYRHAEVISILSSVPIYLWVLNNTATTATYTPQDEEFWQKLVALLTYINTELSAEEFAADRDATLAHQLNTRVVGRFYTALGKAKDRSWLPMAQRYADQILDTLTPASLDKRLPVLVKPRVHLMRQGRYDLLKQLAGAEGAWVGLSHADQIAWDETGRLVIDSTARWNSPAGAPLTLQRRGGRLFRDLPSEVTEALPPELIDVTAAVAKGKTMVTIRHRQSSVTWEVPVESHVEVEPVGAVDSADPGEANAGVGTSPDDPTDGLVTVKITSRATIDVGLDRKPSFWDVHARNSLIGYTNHRAMHTDQLPGPAVVAGRVVQCSRDGLGKLSIDISAKAAGLAGLIVPTADQVRITPTLGGARLNVVVASELFGGPIDGKLVLTPTNHWIRRVARSTKVSRMPVLRNVQSRLKLTARARLSPVQGGVEIEASVKALPGRYEVALSTGGATITWPMILHVGPPGRPRVEST